jgi:choline kinase
MGYARPQMTTREGTTRTAVLLVAGMGTRLSPLTDDRPKALVDIGGETILHRAARVLREHGVNRIVLATGYRQDAIEREVAAWATEWGTGSDGITAVIAPNERYATTQNSVSLALCEEAVRGEAFFKLDGDVVFSMEALERLDASSSELAVAVDGKRHLDAEAMKVTVDGRRITAFGKQLPVEGSAGESIGIERLSAAAGERVFAALRQAIASGVTNRYYEDVYSDLIEAGQLSGEAVEVGDLSWTEVDDLRDLEHARELIRTSLSS